MKNKFLPILLVVFTLTFCGCSYILEIGRRFWGSSTEVLEEARVNAIHKNFQCGYAECFDAILALTDYHKDPESKELNDFQIFQFNRKKGFIVIMGVAKAVDTTEVGIFLVPLRKDVVQIELSSLSSIAKINASEIIFKNLMEKFPEVSQ